MIETAEEIGACHLDPLSFVRGIYPWGEAGTPLEKFKGPDAWQTGLLEQMARDLRADPSAPVRFAVRSGHGVGKTALVSWIIQWFMSTREHPQIVVTANTKNQLKTKTWRELSKWHKMMANSDWFTWTATTFYFNEHPETWCANAIPWSETNSEAFAGTHDENVLMIFDEASGIADVIWDVCEGAMTTDGAMWCAFGNPTRNSGKFHDCFGKQKHRWHGYRVDSRDAQMANRGQIDEWLDDYGEDSDFVRVRVRGEFPRKGSSQLIPVDHVEACKRLSLDPEKHATGQPLLFGVDVARFGDDESVIYIRRGRCHLSLTPYLGLDTMQLADKVMELANAMSPDAIFVDGGGVGGGVIDRLNQLGYRPIEVDGGSSALDSALYANKRAECWGRMALHIKNHCDLVVDQDLVDQLTALEYSFTGKDQILLESKKDLKKRLGYSPDKADALSLTFAETVYCYAKRGKRRRRKSNWRTA